MLKGGDSIYDFYINAAKAVENPGTKAMFEFLAGEEKKHRELLEAEYDKSILAEM